MGRIRFRQYRSRPDRHAADRLRSDVSGHRQEFEPLLLLPIAFGMMLTQSADGQMSST
jgi:hypothetical protein